MREAVFFTIPSAATELGISADAVRTAIDDGIIDPEFVSGRFVLTREDLATLEAEFDFGSGGGDDDDGEIVGRAA